MGAYSTQWRVGFGAKLRRCRQREPGCELHAAREAQLGIDPSEMIVDGARRQVEQPADVPAAQAARDQLRELELARAEAAPAPARRVGRVECERYRLVHRQLFS